MRSRTDLFGAYVPGRSWLHAAPAWAKLVAVLAASLAALVSQAWWVGLALALAAATAVISARLPPRRALGVPVGFALLLVAVVGYNALLVTWRSGLSLGLMMLGTLWATRALLLSTRAPDLVDVLVAACRPLRLVGVSPERVGLAVGLMLRSVPFLIGSFDDVRDAARARGLERNPLARLTPVVVGAVAYAQATGEALAARGLADEAQ